MPVPVLQSFAKKSGKSIEELERYWTEAKEAAKKKGLDPDSPQFFAFVTSVVKSRAGLKESLIEFCQWIVEEGSDLLEQEDSGISPEEQADIDAAAEFAKAAAERGEEPQRPPLIRQFMKSKGKDEQEVRRIWAEAKVQAIKWQERNGTTDQEMLNVALDIMHEIMNQIPDAAGPEEEEEEEKDAQKEEDDEQDSEESEVDKDGDEEQRPESKEEEAEGEKKDDVEAKKKEEKKKANESWAAFMEEVLGEARIKVKNTLSDKDLKKLTKNFTKEKKKAQKAAQKEIDGAKDDLVKGKKHKPGKSFLDAVMLGGLGFVGGLAAITAANKVLDSAFKMFRIG
jgi:hypothetical protein